MNGEQASGGTEGGGGGRRRQPRRPSEGSLCYTVPEAARLIGVSRNQGYELAKSGAIPILRFGSRLRVPKAKLDRMLGCNSESEEKRQ